MLKIIIEKKRYSEKESLNLLKDGLDIVGLCILKLLLKELSVLKWVVLKDLLKDVWRMHDLLDEWSQENQRERYPYCFSINLISSSELSYLIGVRYGDGFLDKYSFKLEVKDKDFAEEFARCAGVVMNRKYEVKPTRNGKYFSVAVYSRVLREFLELSLLDHSEWVEPDYPADFIRGFMDSEGSPKLNGGIHGYGTDKDVLYYISSLLEFYFNITSSVTTPASSINLIGKIRGYLRGRPVISRKICHAFCITGGLSAYEKFYWDIGFSIARKNELLEKLLYKIPHPIWRPEVRLVV